VACVTARDIAWYKTKQQARLSARFGRGAAATNDGHTFSVLEERETEEKKREKENAQRQHRWAAISGGPACER